MSETALARPLLAPYCVGCGIDLGFGGDKILPTAISVDLARPYTQVGNDLTQLIGDARKLHWFQDRSLDYVYSSHLLEDFINTGAVLAEWVRVLRCGGNLVLFLPDESKFRTYCASTGHPYNAAHKHHDFNPDYIIRHAAALECLNIFLPPTPLGPYSFAIVFNKVSR
jgi:predicted SAM-dependent methyltransferase